MSLTEKERNKKLKTLEEQITEIILTEEKYIDDMAKIVKGYLAEFRKETPIVRVPEDLKDVKGSLVFGNIEEIYDWHKDFFLKALQKYQHSPSDLGKAFLICSSQFHMYAKYSNTKSMSEYIVNEHAVYFGMVRKRLGHRLLLSDYLIKPIQRLPLYEIMLSNITVTLKKLEADWKFMHEACLMIRGVLKNVNELTALQGITNYDGDVSDQGPLVFHGFLFCKYDGKKRRLFVFLFKRLLIFTERQSARGKFGTPTYSYRYEVPMNKIQLKVLSNKRFLLKSSYPNCDDVHVVCSGESEELHQQWLDEIKQQLRLQDDLISDLVNPSRCEEREVLM